MFRKVCRLCLATNDLLCVFDEKLSHNNMTEIIQVTSGVEIQKTDVVSQMVCSTCCQITIKMYKFRTTSIKNDKDLKAQCAGYNIAQLATASSGQLPPVLPPSNIKKSPNMNPPKEPPPLTPIIKSENIREGRLNIKPPIPMKYRSAHPSIKELIRKHPNIKLPDNCLNSHVGVYITLLSDEVNEWFYERNMNDADIEKLKKEALELTKERKIPQKRKKSDASEASTSSSSNSTKTTKIRNPNPPKKIKPSDPPPSSKSPTHEIKKIGSVTIVSAKKNVSKVTTSSLNAVKKPSETNVSRVRTSSPNSVKNPSETNSVEKLVDSTSTKKPNNNSVEKEKGERREVLLTALLKVPLPEKTPDKTKTEEITLKSLLQSSDHGKNRRKQQMPKAIHEEPMEIQSSKEKDGSRAEPPEDFEWFTSRPFVDDEQPNKTTPHETFIVSDSDDDSGPVDSEPVDSGPVNSENSSDKYTFAGALNLAPASTDGSNAPDFSLVSRANKAVTLYTCKVCDTQHTNVKDLKVHMKKAHTKCPFCKKRFRTLALRDEHVKRSCPIGPTTITPTTSTTTTAAEATATVTTTIAVAATATTTSSTAVAAPAYTTATTTSFIKLKKPKLMLIRVDEDEEIKKKYASAFENEDEIDEIPSDITEPNNLIENGANVANKKETELAVSKDTVENQIEFTKETERAVLELEQFLKCEEIVELDDTEADSGASTSTDKHKKNKSVEVTDEVICISDDEGDQTVPSSKKHSTKKDIPPATPTPTSQPSPPPPPPPSSSSSSPKPQIKIVNSEVLEGIDINANDHVVIQRILKSRFKNKSTSEENASWVNNPILDGTSSKIKIFKNLRKLLYHYKVPIDVKFSECDISVQYVSAKTPSARKIIDSWETIAPIELKKKQSQPQISLTQKAPNQPSKFTILNGSNLKSYLKPSNSFRPSSTSPATNTSSSTKYAILMPSSMLTPVNTPSVPAEQGPLPVIESVTSVPATIEEPSKDTVATLESITNSLMPTSVSVTNNNNPVVTNTAAEKNDTTTTSCTDTHTTTSEFPAIRVKKLEELVGVK